VSDDQAPIHLVDRRGTRPVSTPILIVKDDPQLRVMFQLLLEAEGHPVVTAADGLEALRRANAMRPSLVILDLELPLLGGHEVGTQLRAFYGEALPIVVVTATGEGAETAGSIAPCAYFRKPFDVDGFLTLIWRCLDASAGAGGRPEE
jgi:DNA-binding response OmpR family regulator